MNFHTLWDNLKAVTSFNAVLSNGTQNGAAVDCQNFRRAGFSLTGWTGAATTLNFTISESADGSNNWTTVPGATLAAAIIAAQADPGVPLALVNIDLAKRKRFLRADIIGTGVAGNASATFFLGQVHELPPGNTAAFIASV